MRARSLRRLRGQRGIVLLRRNHDPALRFLIVLSVQSLNLRGLSVLQRLGRIGCLLNPHAVCLSHGARPRILRAAGRRLLIGQTERPLAAHQPVCAGRVEHTQLLQRRTVGRVLSLNHLQSRTRVTGHAGIVHRRRKIRESGAQTAGVLVVHALILNRDGHGTRLRINACRAGSRLNRVHLTGFRVGAAHRGRTVARNVLSPLQLARQIVVGTRNRSGSSGGGSRLLSLFGTASGKHRTQGGGARKRNKVAAAVNHSDPLECAVMRKYR